MADLDLRCERSFGAVITDALAVLSAHGRAFFPPLFVIIAVPALLEGLVQAALGAPLPAALDLPLPVTRCLVAAATIAYLLLYEDGFFEAESALGVAALWRAMVPLLWPIFAVRLVGLGSLFGLGWLAYEAASAAGSLTAGGVGLVLWVGVAIVVVPGLVLAIPAAVMEGQGPLASLRRGYGLSKDYFFETVGVLVVTLLLLAVVRDTADIAGEAVGGLFASGLVGSGVDAVLGIARSLAGALFYAVVTLQYFSIVARTDAPALDERVGLIGADEEPPLF